MRPESKPFEEKSPQKNNPYLTNETAQLVNHDEFYRQVTIANSWRRATFISVGSNLFISIVAIIALTVNHTQALVFHENRPGILHMIGYANDNATPTELAVKYQLTQWLRGIRDIPDDPGMVDRNTQTVLYTTQPGSPAAIQFQHMTSDMTKNPKILAGRGIRRVVSDVEIHPYSAHSYKIEWTEKMRESPTDEERKATFSGVVQLVGPPQVPSDERIGLVNPAGVYVQDMSEMGWGGQQ